MHKQTKRKLPSIKSIGKNLSFVYFIFFLSLNMAGCNCENPDDPKRTPAPPETSAPPAPPVTPFISSYELEKAVKENDVDKVKKILQPEKGTTDLSAALREAIDIGNLEIVKLLVEKGANVNDRQGYAFDLTPLGKAIASNQLKILEYIIGKGAIIPSNALFKAVDHGNLEIVKLLVKKGANVNSEEGSYIKKTALENAIDKNNTEIVKYLLDNGATISPNALEKAVDVDNLEIVKLLIDKGAKINKKESSSFSMTPLEKAISGNKIKIVEFMLETGQVDITTSEKNMVFEVVESIGQAKPLILDCFLKTLKKKNVTINEFRNDKGQNLFERAFSRSETNDEIIKRLLDEDCNLNFIVNYNSASIFATPFQIAIKRGNLEVIEKINQNVKPIDLKKQINQEIKYSSLGASTLNQADLTFLDIETALHYATRKNDQPLIDLLIKYGAV